MITHYDMTTGEVIEDDRLDEPVTIDQRPAEATSLRLLTVQEAAALQAPAPRVPTDIAMLAVDSLLSRWF